MTERDMELEDKFVMNPRGQKCLVVLVNDTSGETRMDFQRPP
jgi:hypothetical protein